MKQVAKSCVFSTPVEGKEYIQVIDFTGEEFWYEPEQSVLSPGFLFKKWTKKQLIEMFNGSSNAKSSMQEYSMKSLSSKRLERIVGDICELLKS